MLERLASADGVLVLGFRQLTINSGVWRNGTREETDVSDSNWTSPWLHVETGMALATRVPVLVATETWVYEGVFAGETWTSALLGTSAEGPNADVVNAWASTVATRARLDLGSVARIR